MHLPDVEVKQASHMRSEQLHELDTADDSQLKALIAQQLAHSMDVSSIFYLISCMVRSMWQLRP
jgi:hypothetical protein